MDMDFEKMLSGPPIASLAVAAALKRDVFDAMTDAGKMCASLDVGPLDHTLIVVAVLGSCIGKHIDIVEKSARFGENGTDASRFHARYPEALKTMVLYAMESGRTGKHIDMAKMMAAIRQADRSPPNKSAEPGGKTSESPTFVAPKRKRPAPKKKPASRATTKRGVAKRPTAKAKAKRR